MDRWQAMRIFAKVAETASFAETARLMHMSPPAVTRAVAALEETIGARLFVRTTRSVKLTEAGGATTRIAGASWPTSSRPRPPPPVLTRRRPARSR